MDSDAELADGKWILAFGRNWISERGPIERTLRTVATTRKVQSMKTWLFILAGMLASTELHAQVVLGNGIDYNGGLIMRQHHVYLIWYGNWTGNTALTILPDLVMGF